MAILPFGMEHSHFQSQRLVVCMRLHSQLNTVQCEQWTVLHSIRKFSATSLNRFSRPSMMHGILQTQQRRFRVSSMSLKCRLCRTEDGLNLSTHPPMVVAQEVGKPCLIQRTNTTCLMVRHSSSSSWNSSTQKTLMRLLQ